ncbi:MAG: hypothetical protein KF774_16270 [Planctomyces sp.]|nr:hypothetical protein [Planctomyces sp.]
MPPATTVATGARLHFGPLAWKPESGPDFGGWGVMIDRPRCVVRITRETGTAPANASPSGRAVQLLARWLRERPQSDRLAVEVLESLPDHRGLGSGTQLALAIGAAAGLSLDARMPRLSDLARVLERGARSAVGVYGFEQGGLIVDAGKRPGESLGRLAARRPVPRTWRFVLAWPAGTQGLAGDAEASAFRTLPPFPQALTDRLSRLLLCDVLPAVDHGDFDGFAGGLGEYGERVGRAFESLQGGVVHAASLPVWNAVRRRGVAGVAQTSWGPTLAIVQPDAAAAETLCADLRDEFRDSVELLVSQPLNQGAAIVGTE